MARMKTTLIIITLLLLVVLQETVSWRRRRRRRSPPPAINCKWGPWSEEKCNHECGNSGLKIRRRTPVVKASGGGKACQGKAVEELPCNRFCLNGGTPMSGYCTCPSPYSGTCCSKCTVKNCVWGKWGSWSKCVPNCGGSRYKSRTRAVTQEAQCGGSPCTGTPTEKLECEPICLNGGTFRGGKCQCVIPYSGDCCEICNAVDCKWSEWSQWTICEPTCGGSHQRTRVRNKVSPVMCGGVACVGSDTESQDCESICYNGEVFPEGHCVWSDWSAWSSCAPEFEPKRLRMRTRTMVNPEIYGGEINVSRTCPSICFNSGTKTNSCEKSIPTQCELISWSQWSGCFPGCGVNRTRTRTRSVDDAIQCGGLEGDASNFIEQQESCSSLCYNGGVAEDDGCQCYTPYTGACCEICGAVDCEWTEWSSWSRCSPVCGNNRLQSRTRFVRQPSYCGGRCEGSNTSTQPCESFCFNGGTPISPSNCQCPAPFTGACCETCTSINCTWGHWEAWSSCHPKCGINRQRNRMRIIERQPVCGGTCTGPSTEIENCDPLCYNKGTPMNGHCLCPIPFSPMSCCESTSEDPCIHYSLLNNRWRSAGNSELINWSCDTSLNSDTWYRFISVGGTQMIGRCITVNKCGVKFPVWLNGIHPTSPGQIVKRHACVSASTDGVTKCCEHKVTVTIRKCSDFYIYQLPPTRTCEEGYCIAPPPKLYTQPQLYLEETYSGFYLLCVFEYPDHQNASFDVIWSSEKYELRRETLLKSRKATLSGRIINGNHLLIYCKVTATFIYADGTAKSAPSSAIRSRNILICTKELQVRPPEVDSTNASTCFVTVGILLSIVVVFIVKRKRRLSPPAYSVIVNTINFVSFNFVYVFDQKKNKKNDRGPLKKMNRSNAFKSAEASIEATDDVQLISKEYL